MESHKPFTLTPMDGCILDILRDNPKSTKDLRRITGGNLNDFFNLRERGYIVYSSLGKRWMIPKRRVTKSGDID